MGNEKIDRRIKYTKMVLRQSLLELMKTRSINKITVKEICDLADVNRGTFYSHYSDPFDLLKYIENELFMEISTMLEHHALERTEDLLVALFKCIKENSDICKILLGENGDSEFLKKILYIAHDQSISEWKKVIEAKDQKIFDYLYTFTANGTIGILQDWIQSGIKETPEEIATIVMKITNTGVSSFYKSFKASS